MGPVLGDLRASSHLPPDGDAPMKPVNDLSRSLVPFDQESAVVAVIELSNASWLVAGTLPGVARRPLKKLDPDPAALER